MIGFDYEDIERYLDETGRIVSSPGFPSMVIDVDPGGGLDVECHFEGFDMTDEDRDVLTAWVHALVAATMVGKPLTRRSLDAVKQELTTAMRRAVERGMVTPRRLG